MTLHAVNYNVAHQARPATVTEVKNVPISLPLPDGWRVASINACDPDSEGAVEVPFKAEANRLTFTLPSVRIYQVVEIKTE